MVVLFIKILITILVLIHLYLSIYFRKEIKIFNIRNFFGNKYINSFYSLFGVLSIKYYDYISNITSSKVKISIKNLYGEENLKLEEIKFLSKKLSQEFYLFIFILVCYTFLRINLIILYTPVILYLYSRMIDNFVIKKYKDDKTEFKNDLPAFISRLSLLIGSGMNIRTSIKYIIDNSQSNVIEKIDKAQRMVENGYSENYAYSLILSRTDDLLIRKFITNIMLNIEKGGDDIEKILEHMKKESDEFRKTNLILKTQEANSKLLIPNLFIFFGILLMVMLPILLNIF